MARVAIGVIGVLWSVTAIASLLFSILIKILPLQPDPDVFFPSPISFFLFGVAALLPAGAMLIMARNNSRSRTVVWWFRWGGGILFIVVLAIAAIDYSGNVFTLVLVCICFAIGWLALCWTIRALPN